MTLQQILYFQRVARSGSFTKAARACFVSQTAISRQISALEEELHVTLLERDTAHVKLTLAGEYFFQQVNELTARLEEVVTRTQTIAQEQQTRLTLGIPTILEQHAISQLLRQYHSAAFHRGRLPAAAGQPAGGPEDRPAGRHGF